MYLSEDAKSILLLCGNFREKSDKPLTNGEYNKVVSWLVKGSLRPADLLYLKDFVELAHDSGIPEDRLANLMKRGAQLAFTIEEWDRSGLWILCRSDDDYPKKLKEHLGNKAPAIIYGAGNRELLSGGGLGIVGSRDVDAEGEHFTREVAEWCARKKVPVVSGGARGVDQTAMTAALDAGGCSIGMLSDSLLKRSVSKDYRRSISQGRLLLLSAYSPTARFQVWNAMDRNKHIYAMADLGLIISTSHKKGGTWEGASEELRRKKARKPVLVRIGADTPKGNQALLDLGAFPFPNDYKKKTFSELLETSRSLSSDRQSSQPKLDLFTYPANDTKDNSVSDDPHTAPPPSPPAKVETGSPTSEDIFRCIVPVVLSTIQRPLKPHEIAQKLEVQKGQLTTWLKAAVEDGHIRKLKNPVRYQAANVASATDEWDLFSLASIDENSAKRHSKPDTEGKDQPKQPQTAYDAILPILLRSTQTPTHPQELAQRLSLTKAQLDIWLRKTESEGLTRKRLRPLRYQTCRSNAEEE